MGMNESASFVEVQGVTRRYGDVAALSEVSFEIRRGEVLGLVGPNGAGKTTLFECMASVQPLDAGEIIARDGDAGLFYMPDGITPWDGQTVSWVVRFFAGLHADARDETVDVPGIMAATLGLAELHRRRIKELSRGQRKRVLIALSLMTRHPLVLLDEPFEGLDLRQTRQVASILRAAASNGRTLFLSIHQLADAERVCDRMVLLSGGRVVAIGTTTELRAYAAAKGVTDAHAALEDVFLALT
jgi:ABC-type multidrug transport system ATPase subunit